MNTSTASSTPAKLRRARTSPAPYSVSRGLSAISPDGRYRMDQFIPSILGFGKTTWYEGVALGVFPQPVVKSPRMSMWTGQQILDVATDLPALLAKLWSLKKAKRSSSSSGS